MEAKFLTELDIELTPECDNIWVVTSPLRYQSKILQGIIEVPPPFYTDLASVPRLPFIYALWGNRAHREAVIHDYLFRKDSIPVVTWFQANRIFLEAMEARDKTRRVRYPMFMGVMLGSYFLFHKRKVSDVLK